MDAIVFARQMSNEVHPTLDSHYAQLNMQALHQSIHKLAKASDTDFPSLYNNLITEVNSFKSGLAGSTFITSTLNKFKSGLAGDFTTALDHFLTA